MTLTAASYFERLRFAENNKLARYLEPNRQLRADPSIRYDHFDEVHGQALADLQNTSVQEI